AAAFSFELNMLETAAIKERVLNELLGNVADELAQKVGERIGMTPKRRNPTGITPEASAPPKQVKGQARTSPALSMNRPPGGIKGRKIAILAADGVDAKQVAQIKAALTAEGAMAEVIARFAGTIKGEGGQSVSVDKAAPNAPSVVYDAVFIPGGHASVAALKASPLAVDFVKEQYAHYKPIAAAGEGIDLLAAAGIEAAQDSGKVSSKLGVVSAAGRDANAVTKAFIQAIAMHRHFDRKLDNG
ncbi:MAG TPA: DJ-1/PfpI family protein, partial [Humisphaera sp.]|nr:DJ-1/PfpI family protein [Humisphaera sp.]